MLLMLLNVTYSYIYSFFFSFYYESSYSCIHSFHSIVPFNYSVRKVFDRRRPDQYRFIRRFRVLIDAAIELYLGLTAFRNHAVL